MRKKANSGKNDNLPGFTEQTYGRAGILALLCLAPKSGFVSSWVFSSFFPFLKVSTPNGLTYRSTETKVNPAP